MPNVAFDNIATIYDDQFTYTRTGYLQRQLVYGHLEPFLKKNKGLRVLELNCGTGADAIWLAEKGCQVVATDISKEMITTAQTKKEALVQSTKDRLVFKIMAIEQIAELEKEQPFDLIFSNFGGFNCISPQVFKASSDKLKNILTPNGRLVFVIMSRFCWWETIYFLAKLNWKKAWRRQSKTPIEAPLAKGISIKTWYYSPREIQNQLASNFSFKKASPIGLFLPPSYLDPAFKHWPRVMNLFWQLDKRIKKSTILAAQSDHYLVEFLRKELPPK